MDFLIDPSDATKPIVCRRCLTNTIVSRIEEEQAGGSTEAQAPKD